MRIMHYSVCDFGVKYLFLPLHLIWFVSVSICIIGGYTQRIWNVNEGGGFAYYLVHSFKSVKYQTIRKCVVWYSRISFLLLCGLYTARRIVESGWCFILLFYPLIIEMIILLLGDAKILFWCLFKYLKQL
jgi:hypothetical protein